MSLGKFQESLRLGKGLPVTALRLRLLALVLLGLAIGIATAHAHAHLERASPEPDSTVRSAPPEVTLWFTQKLEPSFSSAQVHDAAGARVDEGARVDGMQIHVSVKPLPPGTYKVHWKVLSVDTHTTEGDFSFRVGQ
jgi:copper resistance protein C